MNWEESGLNPMIVVLIIPHEATETHREEGPVKTGSDWSEAVTSQRRPRLSATTRSEGRGMGGFCLRPPEGSNSATTLM